MVQKILAGFLAIILFTSCGPLFEDESTTNEGSFEGKTPIYLPSGVTDLSVSSKMDVEKAEKVIYANNKAYVLEEYLGILIINLDDINEPFVEGYFNIFGILDFDVNDNHLVCNNLNDLLTIDALNSSTITVIHKETDFFDQDYSSPVNFKGKFYCVDPAKGINIGWRDTIGTNFGCRKRNNDFFFNPSPANLRSRINFTEKNLLISHKENISLIKNYANSNFNVTDSKSFEPLSSFTYFSDSVVYIGECFNQNEAEIVNDKFVQGETTFFSSCGKSKANKKYFISVDCDCVSQTEFGSVSIFMADRTFIDFVQSDALAEIQMKDDVLFFLDRELGFSVKKISNNSNLEELFANFNYLGTSLDIGETIGLIVNENELKILDISDPANVVQLKTFGI